MRLGLVAALVVLGCSGGGDKTTTTRKEACQRFAHAACWQIARCPPEPGAPSEAECEPKLMRVCCGPTDVECDDEVEVPPKFEECLSEISKMACGGKADACTDPDVMLRPK